MAAIQEEFSNLFESTESHVLTARQLVSRA